VFNRLLLSSDPLVSSNFKTPQKNTRNTKIGSKTFKKSCLFS